MIIRDINKINTNGKKARDAVADVEKFVINPDVSNGRVLVLYGLRRTGKTTIMEQVLENHRDNRRCAFYEVEDNDTLDDVKKVIIDEKYKGVTLICFDEITKANDFITNSAALPDVFAKEADFFSIGTNDLTGYTMAVDRGNAEVAYLYSAYNPAVLRSIERVIKAGRAEGIMVGMCGEAAADPLLAPLLISFGLSEFSVSATSILATRKGISLWTKEEADAVAAKAMSMTTEAEVEAYLKTVAKH